MEQYLIMLALAIAAGIWRVVDGRGKLWLPIPTQGRNAVTLAIAGMMAYVCFGQGWMAVWAALFAFYGLFMGYADGAWEDRKLLFKHYLYTSLIVVGPFVASHPLGCLAYVVANGLQAEFHYQIASRRIGTPVAYLTEFFAGVSRIGALPLIMLI